MTHPPVPAREGEFYYVRVPDRADAVLHPVEFLPVAEFLQDEESCKALWELIGSEFRTRSKFLTIWPSVRYVAVRGRGRNLEGALLVSAPINWQIDYVVVRPRSRGQGIAAALVQEAVNQAVARKVPYVMLTSRAGLRPFYEGVCGFSVVGSREIADAQRAVLSPVAPEPQAAPTGV